jgi:hypothetical protein
MINRLVALLAAITLAVSLTPATPAQAAYSDCRNFPGTVCLFAYGNFGNPIWRQTADETDYCRSLVGTGWNDVTTTAMNNYSGHVTFRLWQHYNCTGWYYDLPPNTHVDFTGYGQNNAVSAVETFSA